MKKKDITFPEGKKKTSHIARKKKDITYDFFLNSHMPVGNIFYGWYIIWYGCRTIFGLVSHPVEGYIIVIRGGVQFGRQLWENIVLVPIRPLHVFFIRRSVVKNYFHVLCMVWQRCMTTFRSYSAPVDDYILINKGVGAILGQYYFPLKLHTPLTTDDIALHRLATWPKLVLHPYHLIYHP